MVVGPWSENCTIRTKKKPTIPWGSTEQGEPMLSFIFPQRGTPWLGWAPGAPSQTTFPHFLYLCWWKWSHSCLLLLQWGIIKAAEGPQGVKTHLAQENISHGCYSIFCPHSSHQPSPTPPSGRKHRSITRNSGFKSFIFKTWNPSWIETTEITFRFFRLVFANQKVTVKNSYVTVNRTTELKVKIQKWAQSS